MLNAGISGNELLADDGTNGQSAFRRFLRDAIAHTYDIRVIGATLQPDEGAGYWTAQGNTLREAVDNWIRKGGAFDGTADFSTVLEDPADPAELLPGYDGGDHLHPDDAGYRAVAGSVRLGLLSDRSAPQL